MKIKVIFAVIISSLFFARLVWAADLYLFYGEGCPHCAEEDQFLSVVKTRYPDLKINKYEVWQNPENRRLMETVGNAMGADIRGVPLTVIGDKAFSGFSTAKTGPKIEDAITECIQQACEDKVKKIMGGAKDVEDSGSKTKFNFNGIFPYVGLLLVFVLGYFYVIKQNEKNNN